MSHRQQLFGTRYPDVRYGPGRASGDVPYRDLARSQRVHADRKPWGIISFLSDDLPDPLARPADACCLGRTWQLPNTDVSRAGTSSVFQGCS